MDILKFELFFIYIIFKRTKLEMCSELYVRLEEASPLPKLLSSEQTKPQLVVIT